MKRITELDKLECAEYVLDLLGSKLELSEFEQAAEAWIERCKDECIMRRGQYLQTEEVVELMPPPVQGEGMASSCCQSGDEL